MSIVVIGDRAVGKTSMVVSLADLGTKHVKVVSPDPQSLVAKRFNRAENRVAGTAQMTSETLLINVDLPRGEREIQVLWVDTPGEAFSNKDWRIKHPSAWQDIQQQISESQGVILLLPPHRDLIQPDRLDPRTESDDLPTSKAWVTKLQTWLDFFSKNCANVQHIIICIHRADVFCDVNYEGKKWRYDHSANPLWFDYDNHIRNTYFSLADQAIREYKSRNYRCEVRFMITTIDNPNLLELPWIYLGSYLANN
ncbi:MAG: hypothetical protein WBB28_04195 [Crinalium sp.]